MSYSVIDIFCGVGGLTHGFFKEGFDVIAGVDSDPSCRYPYEQNNTAKFIEADIEGLDSKIVKSLFADKKPTILIGCAPCQPFSTYTNTIKEKNKKQWGLLNSFGKLIEAVQPDLVSMENVPSLSGKNVFLEFVESLEKNDYFVSWSNVYCPDYGVPQNRRRLVLFASKLGKINMIEPTNVPTDYITIKDAIGHLQPLEAGETNTDDPLHRSSNLSDLNLKRIQSSVPGGTWRNWDQDLVVKCHLKDSGKSYINVYGRMEWDKPSPTITTQFHLFGTGRFGHPEQDRALSLREGAILQSFPDNYDFLEPESEYYISRIARHIGNAVPVGLARAIAQSIKEHLISHRKNP